MAVVDAMSCEVTAVCVCVCACVCVCYSVVGSAL